MHVHLETERLRLRRFTEADVDALVELDADPAVTRYLTGGRATPLAVVRDELLPWYLELYERYPGYGVWAATDRADGTFLGWLCLRPHEGRAPDDVELGYRLRRAAWGRGLATEGALALVGHGFRELGTRRVFATTMTVNTGSRRVLEKVGLRYLRTFFAEWPDVIEGGDRGDVEYQLLRADWARMGR